MEVTEQAKAIIDLYRSTIQNLLQTDKKAVDELLDAAAWEV
jgi:ribosomal protein S17E